MQLIARLVALPALLAEVSCARPAADVASRGAVPQNVVSQKAAATVQLERRPCYGTCPVYTVALFDDGTVQFDGVQHVAAQGRQTAHIDQRAVADLVARLDRAGFSALPDRFVAGSPSCGDYANDAPTVIVTLRRGTVFKTVQHDRGCAAALSLNALEQAIDSVANTARWIKP